MPSRSRCSGASNVFCIRLVNRVRRLCHGQPAPLFRSQIHLPIGCSRQADEVEQPCVRARIDSGIAVCALGRDPRLSYPDSAGHPRCKVVSASRHARHLRRRVHLAPAGQAHSLTRRKLSHPRAGRNGQPLTSMGRHRRTYGIGPARNPEQPLRHLDRPPGTPEIALSRITTSIHGEPGCRCFTTEALVEWAGLAHPLIISQSGNSSCEQRQRNCAYRAHAEDATPCAPRSAGATLQQHLATLEERWRQKYSEERPKKALGS